MKNESYVLIHDYKIQLMPIQKSSSIFINEVLRQFRRAVKQGQVTFACIDQAVE